MMHLVNDFENLSKIAIILLYIEIRIINALLFPLSLLVKEATKAVQIPYVLHISTGGRGFN